MEIKGLHVAIVHRRFALGGAEEVSRQTACLFSDLGIHTHFFAETHIETEWTLPDDPLIDLSLLPQGMRLWTKESALYLVRAFKERGVKVLIIPIALRNDYLPLIRAAGIKIIYWCHSSPLWELIDRRERASYKAHHPWYKNLYSLTLRRLRLALSSAEKLRTRYRDLVRQVDCFITLTPEYVQEFVSALGLNDEEASRFAVMPNMAFLPKHQPIPAKDRPKKILFVGRLSYADKRPDRVLQIWEKVCQYLPDWEVEIYGKGSEEKFLRRMIQQKQLPRITLKGYIADATAVYASGAILMMTSTYEGWGLVLSEAQASGVVPIAFDSSAGIRELIGKDSTYGCLVAPFDLDAYAAQLRRLCQDVELRSRLSQAAQTHCLDYSPERMRSRWEEIFSQL
ncbi:MAG: glycosyltransferase [Porphyromonas sp.]|uniref:glycosyltransferase n=1 Tax=Porphyromonas sp. TaxID=1924944 RepID=UPI001CB2CE29|nr:glycosyltransferase [Porphyromonas sp.]MBF1389773.1 glycosyltransferase [Porphyromonas sp.]